jgi:hypothetical protein
MPEKLLTIDIDNTLLEAMGDELLPGTEKLLGLLYRACISTVIWTIGSKERIDNLISALEKSDDYFAKEALALVLSAACYSNGESLPEIAPFDGHTEEEISRARALYRKGIKIPIAIGAKLTIDDDSAVHGHAHEFRFQAIDPNANRPREKGSMAINSWAETIIQQVLANI